MADDDSRQPWDEELDDPRLAGIARPALGNAEAVPSTAVRGLPAPAEAATTAGSTEDLEGHSLASHIGAAAAPAPVAGSTADLEGHSLASHIAGPGGSNDTGVRGLRPQPTDPEFQAPKMKTWEKILTPIAIGAAAYRNPEQGTKLMDTIYNEPKREAEARYEKATAAYDKEHPPAKEGLTPEETTIHDLMTGEGGQPRINPDTQKPYTYLEAYTAMNEAKEGAKPGKAAPEKKTNDVVRIVNGVPHMIKVDAATGEDIKDLGQTKIPGEAPGEKRNAAEIAQVEREARGNVRKAEGQYRATQQSVQQLQAGIDAAKDGNGLLTSFVPTMEVLGINASNGVHRISPAEAQAAGMPGSFVERFNSFFDKAATGKLTPQLQKEGKALAKILDDSAYQRYKSTYDDESGIVEGYGGKDFSKHVPVLKRESAEGGGGNQPAAPKAGTVENGFRFNGGDPADQKNWTRVQ
jgi:hypothetical protein